MSAPVPLAGVIGCPAGHSLSPRLHRHWLDRYGVRGHYVPLEVAPDDLARVMAALPAMGFVGANVTIPHKEAVVPLCDVVTDRAALIGAVNTVIHARDGRVHGDNTDGYGFLANLRQGAPEWRPETGPAFVFGAGGAARAVIVALLDAGVPEIRLTNRTRPRSEALRAAFGARVRVIDWVHAAKELPGAATVVNTTSLGMGGEEAFPVSLEALAPRAVVTDLVYTPLDTPFLREAARVGCRTVDGLGMLLHQAVPGFERWFGRRPDVDAAARRAVLP